MTDFSLYHYLCRACLCGRLRPRAPAGEPSRFPIRIKPITTKEAHVVWCCRQTDTYNQQELPHDNYTTGSPDHADRLD